MRALQNVRRAGKTITRQASGHQACRRGVCSVQLFGIGGGSQKLPQSGRLRASRAKGVLHLHRAKTQQTAHRRGSRQRAGGAGGVKHLVVRAPQKFAYPDADFITRHCRRQQLLAAAAQRLRHRQGRRKHHGGRMEHRTVVHIVLLGHMRSRCVSHGRKVGAALASIDQHFGGGIGRPGRRPHAGGEAGDGFDRARTLAGHRRAEPVHKQVFDLAYHRGGNSIEFQTGGKGGKLRRGAGSRANWKACRHGQIIQLLRRKRLWPNDYVHEQLWIK